MKEGRITEEHKTNYHILSGEQEYVATVRGSFFDTDHFPKVGDRVLYEEIGGDKAVIEEVLPRTSSIVRKAAHTGEPQVIVTNVDVMFIVMGLDGDFNLSRLERYLLLATQSKVTPVILLNKADTVNNVDDYIQKVTATADEKAIHAVSALTGEGMEALVEYFNNHATVVLLGSSGAGKSTITNWLLREDKQGVASVRKDDSQGRHTTTSRQLFVVPTGGYLIDTPGMRELGVVDSLSSDEDIVFAKIDTLAQECQFSNCEHEKSAGCAVQQALENGGLQEREVTNYQKVRRERFFEESKNSDAVSREYKQRQKRLHQKYRKNIKKKDQSLLK